MKGVFSIGIDRRFADELAAGVLAEYGRDPLKLADILILLPTRRSVRSLREAFLRASNGKPTLLPRMAPLGDLDDDVWDDLPGGDALTLPPAIGRPEREALLSELVLRFQGRRWRADRADLGSGAEACARAGQPARRARDRRRAVRQAGSAGRRQLRHPLAPHAEVPRHRRRALAADPGRAQPDRRAGPAHPRDPRPGSALARAAARDAGDRRRLDRLAARHARADDRDRRSATRRRRAARPRPRDGRGELEQARPDPSAIRPARTAEGVRLRAQGRGRVARRAGRSAHACN